MKSFSGGSGSLKRVELLFEACDVGVEDRGVAGDAQLAAEVEQLVLHRGQQRAHVARAASAGEHQADRGVGLVDRAVGARRAPNPWRRACRRPGRWCRRRRSSCRSWRGGCPSARCRCACASDRLRAQRRHAAGAAARSRRTAAPSRTACRAGSTGRTGCRRRSAAIRPAAVCGYIERAEPGAEVGDQEEQHRTGQRIAQHARAADLAAQAEAEHASRARCRRTPARSWRCRSRSQ